MKSRAVLSCLLSGALAYPSVMQELQDRRAAEMMFEERAPNATVAISQAEDNCGPKVCPFFNAKEQYVSTSGKYAYKSPTASQIRGPCPGLNAAANHGYLPRSGVASIAQSM
jgi:hypothetical protein